jgi:hypothetical protein
LASCWPACARNCGAGSTLRFGDVLEAGASRPRGLRTETGVGYRFVPDDT